MIISASRRTDIPSYYSDWFFHRLEEGYVLVRNPWNARQVSRIRLSPEVVDGIVFWTKNPAPMLRKLDRLGAYHYYFQFTLTAYGPEVEQNLPSKNRAVIPAFQQLSREIGKDKVIWRYDPIFFNETYTLDYHCRYFEMLAAKLAQYTETCTVSFLDFYKNTRRNADALHMQTPDAGRQTELLGRLAKTAKEYGISLDACAEEIDFGKLGVFPARCIDKARFEKMGGCRLEAGKDRNQRSGCGCVESIDIGAYNTCRNGCLYCYANYDARSVEGHFSRHNPQSPLLFGEIEEGDAIRERNVRSFADGQMTLFDLGEHGVRADNM